MNGDRWDVPPYRAIRAHPDAGSYGDLDGYPIRSPRSSRGGKDGEKKRKGKKGDKKARYQHLSF